VSAPYVLTVNGSERRVEGGWVGESLAYVLRERLGLPATKTGCEQGECGSCSVMLDDVLVCSCLVLARQAQDRVVVTVEGLAPADDVGLVQQAFIETGAVQCGFCTPGFIMATEDLLRRAPAPDDAEIREALAGNLCRCTGYEKILDAVRLASARLGVLE
jgi:carbon-monoxide dehydrogenase small subunit